MECIIKAKIENYTSVMDQNHPLSIYCAVFDKDGNEVRHVKSYDIQTQIAEIAEVEEVEQNGIIIGRAKLDENGLAKIKRVLLEGSKIMFRK